MKAPTLAATGVIIPTTFTSAATVSSTPALLSFYGSGLGNAKTTTTIATSSDRQLADHRDLPGELRSVCHTDVQRHLWWSPDLIGDPRFPSSQRRVDHWYNEKAFAIPTANAGCIGNAGRNIIQGPGFQWMNFGIFKLFPVHESARIVFSMTSNNFLNHPDYKGIGNGINTINPSFISSLKGDVSGYARAGYMREIYFNLSLEL